METVRFDMRDVERGMTRLEAKQVPFASVMALNATAQDVLTDLQSRMDVAFDKPTRFTKNAFMVWRATKATMQSAVQERPSVGKRHYLKVQEFGGARGQTGMEGMLKGVLASSASFAAAVPASGAKLDASGNWSRSQRNQVLGAIKDGRSAMAKASGAKSKVGYFASKPGTKLSQGVYKRDSKGGVTKVLSLVPSLPAYTDRLGFQEGAERVASERMAVNFADAFAKAMASAK